MAVKAGLPVSAAVFSPEVLACLATLAWVALAAQWGNGKLHVLPRHRVSSKVHGWLGCAAPLALVTVTALQAVAATVLPSHVLAGLATAEGMANGAHRGHDGRRGA